MPLRERPAGPPAADVRPQHHGVGRASSRAAERVSDALRREDHPHLTARRRVALLQTVASAALSVVALYQYGIFRRVPEPRIPGLGADAVDASGEAYSMLRTPDSALGIASAGVSLALAGMGDADRAQRTPLLPLAMFAKLLADAAGGVVLTAEQVTKHRKVCSWCTVTSVALVASVPAAWPEVRDALRALRRR